MSDYCNINELEGKTVVDISQNGYDQEAYIEFTCSDGWIYKMHHEQDCTEYVCIEDINGDLDDLVGCRMDQAEETCNSKGGRDNDDSETWTFYHFGTIKGYVTIRWHGSSNGYYSEGVDIEKRFDLKALRNGRLTDLLDGE